MATKKLTTLEREEKALEAVRLSAQGKTNREIAEAIDVNRNTVRKLIDDEYARRAEHRDQDKERAISVYVEIQRKAWERFEETDNRSLNASGYLNTIKAAQDSINKITGAEAPIKYQDVEEEYEIVFEDADSLNGAS